MSGVIDALHPAIRTVVVTAMLTLFVNAGYGLAFLVWRGMSLPEVLSTLPAGAPFVVLGFFLAVVGVILGDRLAAYRSGPGARSAGLLAGVGLALSVLVVNLLRGHIVVWPPPNTVLAVVGGWWGTGIGNHT